MEYSCCRLLTTLVSSFAVFLRARSFQLLLCVCLLIVAGGSVRGVAANGRIKRLIVQQERDLVEGVRYARYKTNGSRPIALHVVTLDRTIAGNAVRVVKGKDHASSREMLRDMSARYEIENGDAVLAVVNANFWAAVRNNPIGPCVIDGEVVEMTPYKQWSSAFFDIRNRIVIDTFKIMGTVQMGSRSLAISSTNRRSDSTEVVLYNRFAGETVPYVTADQIEWLFKEAQKDEKFLAEDSTEVELTEDMMRRELAKAQIESSREYPMMKVRLRYLRTPGVNVATPCRVLDCDTGQVDMPLRGCVVSFPRDSLAGPLPQPGDTVSVTFRTNVRHDLRFMNAVCGQPVGT